METPRQMEARLGLGSRNALEILMAASSGATLSRWLWGIFASLIVSAILAGAGHVFSAENRVTTLENEARYNQEAHKELKQDLRQVDRKLDKILERLK